MSRDYWLEKTLGYIELPASYTERSKVQAFLSHHPCWDELLVMKLLLNFHGNRLPTLLCNPTCSLVSQAGLGLYHDFDLQLVSY